MRAYEEIGKAITQGFLFMNGNKYYITEIQRICGENIFTITDENRTLNAGVNIQSDNWTAEPVLSAEDIIRLEILTELGYDYIRNYNSTVQVSQDFDFDAYETLYCFDSVPEGTYVIGEHYELIEVDY